MIHWLTIIPATPSNPSMEIHVPPVSRDFHVALAPWMVRSALLVVWSFAICCQSWSIYIYIYRYTSNMYIHIYIYIYTSYISYNYVYYIYIYYILHYIIPECVARVPVSLWGSGGWECVPSTLRPRPQPFATVRNRPQPFATVRTRSVWPCLWEVLQRWSFLEVSDVSLLRFAWQAWHFVTFRRVLQRVENRFAWQAQYFCDVFRRCVAVFVAGAALWTCPSSFFVAGAAL